MMTNATELNLEDLDAIVGGKTQLAPVVLGDNTDDGTGIATTLTDWKDGFTSAYDGVEATYTATVDYLKSWSPF